MTTTTHTPGPWTCTPAAVILAPNPIIPDALAVEVAQVHNVYGKDGWCQTPANCHLIAASPALYDALKSASFIVDFILPRTDFRRPEDRLHWEAAQRNIHAALAKAEGRA